MAKLDKFMNMMEALTYLSKKGIDMHYNTFYERLRSGEIKAKKMFNKWHISQKELDKYVRGQ